MTLIHNDYILFCTDQWAEIKNIVEKCGGIESEVIDSIQRLEIMGFLESRSMRNTYLSIKKYDRPQTREEFCFNDGKFYSSYQKSEIESIKTIPTLMLTDGSQFGFTTEGLKLLEHIQEEIDRIFMIITRVDLL